MSSNSVRVGLMCGYCGIPAASLFAGGLPREAPAPQRFERSHPARFAPMPAETKGFAMFPHDWHSTDYVAEWVTRDAARDPERRLLLRQMLSFAPFSRDAELEVLDVGAGYGAVS